MIVTYGEGALVVRSQLSVHDGIRKLKVGLRLLVTLEHIHTAAKVVVNCGSIDGVAT